MQEQIVRQVSRVGNGAHIFTPKEWIGEEIVLVRTLKKPLIERIFSVITPFLMDIKGVYLYGSRAREEAEKDSDIDIFIITSEKIKIKAKDFEIIAIEESKIKDAIKLAPIMIYSIFSEAKPIINASLLENLKKQYKPLLKDFKEFLEETNRIIKIDREILELDKEEGLYTDSCTTSYSAILRLRGVFIINQILAGKRYTHKEFKSWILKKLPKVDYEVVYRAYKTIKSNKKEKTKTKISDLEEFLKLLEKEISILHKKSKKGNGKEKKTP